MAQSSDYTPVTIYRSETAGALPAAANLNVGELAVNVADAALYTKDSSENIIQLSSGAGIVEAFSDLDTEVSNLVDDTNSATYSSVTTLITNELETSLRPTITFNSDTGYTLAASAESSVILFTSASAVTVTVPTNANVTIPVGYIVHLHQNGTGTVSVTGQSGVTIQASEQQQTRTQYSSISLIKVNTNAWIMIGDMALA